MPPEAVLPNDFSSLTLLGNEISDKSQADYTQIRYEVKGISVVYPAFEIEPLVQKAQREESENDIYCDSHRDVKKSPKYYKFYILAKIHFFKIINMNKHVYQQRHEWENSHYPSVSEWPKGNVIAQPGPVNYRNVRKRTCSEKNICSQSSNS